MGKNKDKNGARRRKRKAKDAAPKSARSKAEQADADKLEQGMAVMRVLQARERSEAEVRSTERGRRSVVLRERAHPLSAVGRQDEAHPLFVEAASMFAEGDEGAAAAVAWFDLAESFKRLDDERGVENLQAAEQLLRRCLASPARRRDPLRMALTHDSLGQVLRRLANHVVDARAKVTLEDESIAAHQRACDIVVPLPVLGDTLGPRYLGNLGNALARRARVEEAILRYEQALEGLDRSAAADPRQLEMAGGDQPPQPALRMNFAEMLARVDDQGLHVDRAVSLADLSAAEGDRELQARAHYLALVTLHKHRPQDQAALERRIELLEARHLPAALLAPYIERLITLGHGARALRITRNAQREALQLRQDALADHAADGLAERAQRFGLLEARIHVAEGRHVEAFLAIENVSALRYYDNVKLWGWSHRDPIARVLTERARALSSRAMRLDELASHLVEAPRAQQAEVLRALADGLRGAREEARRVSEHELVSITWMVALIRMARGKPSPVAFLRQSASELLSTIRRLNVAASQREPEHARERLRCDAPVARDELVELLREHPGTVMLRLHWSSELLAVAVWLEDGRLVSKAARLPLRVDSLSPSLHLASFQRGKSKQPYTGPPMAEILAELDLGAVLPPIAAQPRGHLLLLPSSYASLIPWAAAGPRGQTLLDRFEAISWLPNLTPLRMRQEAWRERTGSLSVCPGSAQKHKASLYPYAFARERADELRLFEAEATLANTRAAARSANVVSFYAHGSYKPDAAGHLILAHDEKLEVDELGWDFAGCERVELWACKTGMNRSTSRLTPFFVDEAFGIDTAFHHHGVRSTIGSLWNVNQLVTMKILGRYRAELEVGHPAPSALARAQRWWRDQLPQVRRWLDELHLDDAWRSILHLLDVNEVDVDAAARGTLNHKGQPTPESVWAAFSPPEAWAGFRFMGVYERRPLGEPLPQEIVLGPEERAEFDAILAQKHERPLDPDERLHERRFALYEAIEGRSSPMANEAVEAARTYAEIRQGRPSHRLLRGLAWLHEALANEPSLAERAMLEREAAWMWLALARGELPDERLRLRYLADPVYVARLDGLAARRRHPDREILLAWAWLLQRPSRAAMDEDSAVEELVERWELAWRCASEQPPLSYEGLRARTAAASLLLALPKPPAGAIKRVRAEVDELGTIPSDLYARACALLAVSAELAARRGDFSHPEPEFPWLRHAEIVLQVQRAHLRVADDPSPENKDLLRSLEDNGLSKLESDYWGVPSNTFEFWRTSGVPGLAWHWSVAAFSHGRLAGREDPGMVVHVLAGLQLGCDLRLGPLSAFARLLGAVESKGAPSGQGRWPWELPWRREHLLNALEQATRLRTLFGAGVQANQRDPYRLSQAELLEPFGEDTTALASWELADSTRRWSSEASPAKTAAFATERYLCSLDRYAEQVIPDMLENLREQGLAKLPERFDDPDPQRAIMQAQAPMIRIQAAERTIREQMEGTGTLGVSSGSRGELCFALGWRERSGLQTRQLVCDGLGLRVRALLGQLFDLRLDDAAPRVGVDGSRGEVWSKLCQLLDRPLGQLLADVPRCTTLSVLSPGFLRPLPWAGLTRKGRALREDFIIAHLPHLGFGQSSHSLRLSTQPATACVLGGEREDGETRFGEATIATLRACFPVLVEAEPDEPVVGTTILEVDAIQPLVDKIQCLRFYGSTSPVDFGQASAAIRLRGRRGFRAFNFSGTFLPYCELVEIWAATGRASQVLMIRDADHDRVPGLAWAALASGAAGVVDLAWPVHDLVKALVCERFGLLRRVDPQLSSVALMRAVSEVDHLMARWGDSARDGWSVGDAIDWLDQERGRFLSEHGLDHRKLVVYTNHLDAPCVDFPSAQELVRCCRRPDQLAPFRWWGSPRPGVL